MQQRYAVTPVALGLVLQQLRRERGLSLTQVSQAVGLSRSHVWGAERGAVNITVGVLVKLANVYRLEPSEIIFRAEETIVGVTEPSDKPIEVTMSKAAQFTLCYDCLHKYACGDAERGVVECKSFDAMPRPPGPERAPIADRHRRHG